MLIASDFFWPDWMVGGVVSDFAPKAGVSEGESEFTLNIDLPGFKKDDLQIEVKEDQLIIKGERHQQRDDDGYHREERSFGTFERRFTLPDSVDSANITVSYHDGVLQITLPKREEVAPRRLEITG